MTPDELRALAGKLRKLQAGEAYEAAAYLRACADAQPVAWLYRDWANVLKVSQLDPHEDGAFAVFAEPQPQADAQPVPAVPAGWKVVPVEPTPEMLSAVGMMDGYDWHAPGCSPDADHANWYSAMIAAAPAAPQAEPIDPHMIVAEDRFPDVPAERWKPCPQCGEDFDRECPICDGLGRVLATDGEQAEPKREPLTARRILEIEDDASRQWRDNGRIIEYAVVFARMIERAHGI